MSKAKTMKRIVKEVKHRLDNLYVSFQYKNSIILLI